MKKNKVIEFIKNNWYYTLLVIPFVFFCIVNKAPNNDIWFLMNNGRYVLNSGIPHIDPFTIHEGLPLVMQQWLSSIVFYSVYHYFGKSGLLSLMIILFIIIVFISYKLFELVSGNRKKAVLITTVVISCASKFIITRPQCFTFIILLIETYCLEEYFKKGNHKKLYLFPLLSLLLINLHSSMWLMQFVFILPFLANYFIFKYDVSKKVSIKRIIIIVLFMFLVGFINPYGYKSITYLFYSFGIDNINIGVLEMMEPVFSLLEWKITIASLFILMFLITYMRKKKYALRYFCFVIGLFLLSAMHRKGIAYYLLWYGYAIAPIDFKLVQIKNKYYEALKRGLIVSISICMIITLFTTVTYSYKYYSVKNKLDDLVDYIIDNYNKDDVVLYVDFDNGGYTEYRGLKSYIDPRAEMFSIKYNKKEDILGESIAILSNPNKDKVDSFIDKYKFTHLIVEFDTTLDRYLGEKEDYEVKYVEYFDDAKELPLYKLYVKELN